MPTKLEQRVVGIIKAIDSTTEQRAVMVSTSRQFGLTSLLFQY